MTMRALRASSRPLPGMVPNNAGGFAYRADDWTRLDRFLILGTEGGTYYVGEATLTLQNAEVVARCLAADGERTVGRARDRPRRRRVVRRCGPRWANR